MQNTSIFFITLIALLLTACGGGSSDVKAVIDEVKTAKLTINGNSPFGGAKVELLDDKDKVLASAQTQTENGQFNLTFHPQKSGVYQMKLSVTKTATLICQTSWCKHEQLSMTNGQNSGLETLSSYAYLTKPKDWQQETVQINISPLSTIVGALAAESLSQANVSQASFQQITLRYSKQLLEVLNIGSNQQVNLMAFAPTSTLNNNMSNFDIMTNLSNRALLSGGNQFNFNVFKQFVGANLKDVQSDPFLQDRLYSLYQQMDNYKSNLREVTMLSIATDDAEQMNIYQLLLSLEQISPAFFLQTS